MKSFFVSILFSTIVFISYSLQSPAHESKIILLGLANNMLYSMDDNGLLHIYNTIDSSQTFRIPIRNSISHSYFQYPYIVIIDVQRNMHVYNIQNDFIEYSTVFLASHNGYAIFSEDFSYLAYTTPTSIDILNTDSWHSIISLEYSNLPSQFLVISQNKQNIMSYSYDGTIEYRNISNGSLLKTIKSDAILSSLILNAPQRFGIGFTSRTLTTLDMINGTTNDSLLFSETILSIFASLINNTVIINLVSLQGDKSYNIRMFQVDDNGTILENDLVTINTTEHISQVISDNQYMFVGFTNGEIFRYTYTQHSPLPFSITTDNTLAIYDSIYLTTNNSITLTTGNGMLSVPLPDNFQNNIQTVILPKLAKGLLDQPMNNPVFITTSNYNTDDSPVYVMSNNVPYHHRIAPQSRSNNNHQDITAINTDDILMPNDDPTLLFSVKNTSQTYAPKPIPSNITHILINSTHQIYYSQPNSHLYINSGSEFNKFPLFVSRFLFDLSFLEDDDQSILWTNTPLTTSTTNELPYNMLYAYNIDQAPNLLFSISLPFIASEINNFQSLNIAPPSLIVSTINPLNNTTTFLLVKLPDNYEHAPLPLFPQNVQSLSELSHQNVIKTIPIGQKKDKILIFTKDYISIISVDLSLNSLEFEHKITYPKEFGLFLNANATALDVNQYLITMIDKNNTVSVVILELLQRLTPLTSFNVYNDNSIVYLR